MAHFCGAWSISGQPIETSLTLPARQAMLATLGLEHAGRHEDDRLWLSSDPVLRDEDSLLIVDGWLARPLNAASLLALERPPYTLQEDGHYVAVHAAPGRRCLTLMRDPSGGARLYFLRTPHLLAFSTRLSALLASGLVPRELDPTVIDECVLNGRIHFGNGTFVEGIEELPAGHVLRVSGDEVALQFPWAHLLGPVEGDLPELARRFRRTLVDNVQAAIGSDREIAISLSSGIDSAALAVLASEAVGPANVHAFTYDFESEEHPSELEEVAEFCRFLGIRHHHVVRIPCRTYMEAAPALITTSEDFGYWRKAFTVPLLSAMKERGHGKYLTGFGVGSHTQYFENLDRVLEWLPAPNLVLRVWNLIKSDSSTLRLLPPGLEPPFTNVLFPLLCVLEDRGIVKDIGAFYPRALQDLARRARAGRHVAAALEQGRGLSVGEQMRLLSYVRTFTCMDATRMETVARDLGVVRVSPAFFASCIPFSHMPVHPAAEPMRSAARRTRPGKLLLAEAMRDSLPPQILFKRKQPCKRPQDPRRKRGPEPRMMVAFAQATAPPGFVFEALQQMDAVVQEEMEALEPFLGTPPRDLLAFLPESLRVIPLWKKLVLDAPVVGGQPGQGNGLPVFTTT